MPTKELRLPYTKEEMYHTAELVSLTKGGPLWKHLGFESKLAYWDMLDGKTPPTRTVLMKLRRYQRTLVEPHKQADTAYWENVNKWK